jgi:hypothetical protein
MMVSDGVGTDFHPKHPTSSKEIDASLPANTQIEEGLKSLLLGNMALVVWGVPL